MKTLNKYRRLRLMLDNIVIIQTIIFVYILMNHLMKCIWPLTRAFHLCILNPRVIENYVMALVRTIVNHRMVLYRLLRNILLMLIIIPIILLFIRLLLLLLLAIRCLCVSRVMFSFFFFICVLWMWWLFVSPRWQHPWYFQPCSKRYD